MKLKSPELERHLRRQARRELRQSRALWKEYRQRRVRWWKKDYRWPVQVFTWGYLLLWLMVATYKLAGHLAFLSAFSLYATATAILRTSLHLIQGLWSGDRLILFPLPVSDDAFLKRQVGKLYRSWAGAWVVFLSAYGFDAAMASSFRQRWAVILLAATLQAVAGMSLGIILRLCVPRIADYRVMLALWGLIGACWFLPPAAIRSLWSAVLLTPGGWISHGYAALVGSAPKQEMLLFLPALLLAACLPVLLPRLRQKLLNELQSQTMDGLIASLEGMVTGSAQQRAADPFSTVSVQPGRLSEAANWAGSSWLERLVGAWLTDRQKLVAEFMLGGQLGSWSKRWRNAMFFTAGGLILTFAPPSLPDWVAFLPLLIAAMIAAPILGGFWPGFHSPFPYRQSVPVYGAFPVSFDEISGVMLKTNVLRTLTWSPLFIAYNAAFGLRTSVPLQHGIEIGIEVVLVVMAWQLLAIVGHFVWNRASTTTTLSWRYIVTVILSLWVFAAFLTGAVTMFMAEGPLWKASGIAGMFVSPLTGWALYRWRFNRGRVDLVTIPLPR